jgi:hypothetical protein
VDGNADLLIQSLSHCHSPFLLRPFVFSVSIYRLSPCSYANPSTHDVFSIKVYIFMPVFSLISYQHTYYHLLHG